MELLRTVWQDTSVLLLAHLGRAAGVSRAAHLPRLACHLPKPSLHSVRPQPFELAKKGRPIQRAPDCACPCGAHRVSAVRPL